MGHICRGLHAVIVKRRRASPDLEVVYSILEDARESQGWEDSGYIPFGPGALSAFVRFDDAAVALVRVLREHGWHNLPQTIEKTLKSVKEQVRRSHKAGSFPPLRTRAGRPHSWRKDDEAALLRAGLSRSVARRLLQPENLRKDRGVSGLLRAEGLLPDPPSRRSN